MAGEKAKINHKRSPKKINHKRSPKDINLKLLVDGKSQKVLFAEAGKDFVDFIFSFLTFPLGSIIKLLSPLNTLGSIGKLYQSVENLNETYLVANRDKSSLLQPSIAFVDGVSPLLMGTDAMAEIKYYLCRSCCKKVTTAKNINCPSCMDVMSRRVDLVMPSVSANSSAVSANSSAVSAHSSATGSVSRRESVGFVMIEDVDLVMPSVSANSSASINGGENVGFVKGVITYMITDDLEITPLSSISSIMLINRFNMKNDIQLKEKSVVIGMKEGLALLKASLKSHTALTDVFLSSHEQV